MCIVHVFAPTIEQGKSFEIPIDICGETLPIYGRLAADVRVWRRCSVVVDCCGPDVEGGGGSAY